MKVDVEQDSVWSPVVDATGNLRLMSRLTTVHIEAHGSKAEALALVLARYPGFQVNLWEDEIELSNVEHRPPTPEEFQEHEQRKVDLKEKIKKQEVSAGLIEQLRQRSYEKHLGT